MESGRQEDPVLVTLVKSVMAGVYKGCASWSGRSNQRSVTYMSFSEGLACGFEMHACMHACMRKPRISPNVECFICVTSGTKWNCNNNVNIIYFLQKCKNIILHGYVSNKKHPMRSP